MKIYKISLLTTAILLLSVISCRQDKIEPIIQEGNSFLGKKLENPYTLEVMQQAWENVIGQDLTSGRLGAKVKLDPTHYYVQFKPKDEREVDLLFNSDTTIYFYPYPLDYELTVESNNYRDPGIPEGEPRYQYAAVPVQYDFPSVKYKILDEAFIPEDVPETNSAYLPLANDECVPIQMTAEAFRITNNLSDSKNYPNAKVLPDPCDPGGGSGSGGCSYCPQGTMRVWDSEASNFVPIQGLEVKARVFLTTKSAFTDGTGKYIISHNFSGTPQYSFKWKRYDFVIRDAWLDAAEVIGPKTNGWWSEDFEDGTTSEYHGTIFRAAHHYYHGNILGLRRPPRNSFFGYQVKIQANFEEGRSSIAPWRRFVLTSAIQIYSPDRNNMRIYATTIHELAHASHWAINHNDFNFGDDLVVETWAHGATWAITRTVYPNYWQTNFRIQDGDDPDDEGNYTGLVEDMIDGMVGYDDVEGYSIRQIEDALVGARIWFVWESHLILNNENNTEDNLPELFDYWH